MPAASIHALSTQKRARAAKLIEQVVPQEEIAALALDMVAAELVSVALQGIDEQLASGTLEKSVQLAIAKATTRPEAQHAVLPFAIAALLRDNVARSARFILEHGNRRRQEALRLEGEARALAALAEELETAASGAEDAPGCTEQGEQGREPGEACGR